MRHSDSVSVSGIRPGGYIYNHKPHSRSHGDAFTAVVIVWATQFQSFIAPLNRGDYRTLPVRLQFEKSPDSPLIELGPRQTQTGMFTINAAVKSGFLF